MDISSENPGRGAERLYRLLLHAYPPQFRRQSAPEMLETFSQQWEKVRSSGVFSRFQFWSMIIADVALSALPEWAISFRRFVTSIPSTTHRAGRMETTLQDLRYALRSLRRAPVFTFVAALTVAIGIGATTTIFSVANSLLLRAPIGVREPGALVTAHRLGEGGSSFHSFSYPSYADLGGAGSGLTGLAAYGIFPASLSTEQEPQILLSMLVTGNYFQVTETRAAIGRLLLPADDRGAAGADPVVVLSYRTWMERFNSDPHVLGRSITINRNPMVIVGVAEKGFQGHTVGMDVGAWIPMGMSSVMGERASLGEFRASWLELIGRKAAGVSARQVSAALTATAASTAERYGTESQGVDVRRYAPVPASAILPIAGFLGLLLVISGIVLFIASVNVGGLLLSRSLARSREIAIRLAIGAGRHRLVRQLLTESILLFGLGGAAGIGLTFIATRALARFSPPIGMPINFDFHPDLVVLSIAIVVTLTTGIIFGLLPALQSTRPDLARAVRDEHLGGRFRRSRLRGAFVVVQVAGSVLLLVVGGLFVRALSKAGAIDLGFTPADVHVAAVDLRVHNYTEPQEIAFVDQVERSLNARGGFLRVGATDVLPLAMNNQSSLVVVEGRDPVPNTGLFETDFSSISAGYFETMRIPIQRGRDFTEQDKGGAPGVVILNQSLAKKLWPGVDPLGKRLSFGSRTFETPLEVVGVVTDSKSRSLGGSPEPTVYLPLAQNPSASVYFVVRTQPGAPAPAALLRQAIHESDPAIPLLHNAPLLSIIGISLLPNRIAAIVAGLLGAIGLLLAAVGLYGLLAYAVSRRQKEIGIRMALGASSGDVRRLVLGEGFRLTVLGLLIGFALALAATRLLRSMLFGVSPADPLTFLAIASLLVFTALIACAMPVRRATQTDPMVALRNE
ncbi:MAG: ABC transporter permease [Gemmatimonadota bacterium]